MDEHSTARWSDEPSRPSAGRFPLWAGDVPASDSAAEALIALGGDAGGALHVDSARCTSLAELAAARRQVKPPPLPKRAVTTTAPGPLRHRLLRGSWRRRLRQRHRPVPTRRGSESTSTASAAATPPAATTSPSEQLPCWLTSLVLHLCLVIGLNAYVVYLGSSYGGGTAKLATPARWCESRPADPICRSMAGRNWFATSCLTRFPFRCRRSSWCVPRPLAPRPPTSPASTSLKQSLRRWDPRATSIWDRKSSSKSSISSRPSSNRPRRPSRARAARPAASGNRHHDPGRAADRSRARSRGRWRPTGSGRRTSQGRHRQPVHRVRLGPLAGNRGGPALCNFQGLRPDSIPALVRGLNPRPGLPAPAR